MHEHMYIRLGINEKEFKDSLMGCINREKKLKYTNIAELIFKLTNAKLSYDETKDILLKKWGWVKRYILEVIDEIIGSVDAVSERYPQ